MCAPSDLVTSFQESRETDQPRREQRAVLVRTAGA